MANALSAFERATLCVSLACNAKMLTLSDRVCVCTLSTLERERDFFFEKCKTLVNLFWIETWKITKSTKRTFAHAENWIVRCWLIPHPLLTRLEGFWFGKSHNFKNTSLTRINRFDFLMVARVCVRIFFFSSVCEKALSFGILWHFLCSCQYSRNEVGFA